MPRFCENYHPELTYKAGEEYRPGSCHVCWKYVNDDAFRRMCDSGEATRGLTGLPPAPEPLPLGPGTELHALLDSLGLFEHDGCKCPEVVKKMNAWGVAGCIEHRPEIIEHLKEEASKRSWGEWWAAGRRAVWEPWFSPLDPFGSMVDEAIRLAQDKIAS